MKGAPPARPCARNGEGFTLVELLLAVALGSLVALILASLLHGLVIGERGQSRILEGPVAARSALLRLARETACAFAPPDPQTTPLALELPDEPGGPEVRLSFHLPVPSRAPQLPGFHGVEKVRYEVRAVSGARAEGGMPVRELVRISSPCAGPLANDERKEVVLRGPFALSVRVSGGDGGQSGDSTSGTWPPAGAGAGKDGGNGQAPLPPALWFSIRLPGQEAIVTEALVHCAHVLGPPKGRKPAVDGEGEGGRGLALP